jgi:hypothetical protein
MSPNEEVAPVRPECFDRKAFKDADFHREYKKLTGEEPDPLMPEEMEKAIREMPRDAEVTDLLKKLSAEGPLPAR